MEKKLSNISRISDCQVKIDRKLMKKIDLDSSRHLCHRLIKSEKLIVINCHGKSRMKTNIKTIIE